MNKISAYLFLMLFVVPAAGDSLLTAQKFPKTFEDLSFTARMEVIRDGFAPYDVEYDNDGACISGCAYYGITTIKKDMEAIEEATKEIAELIKKAEETEVKPGENPENKNQLANYQKKETEVKPGENPENKNQLASYQKKGPEQIATTPIARDWCNNGLSTSLPLRYPVDMTDFKHKISGDFGFRASGPNGGNYLHGGLDINTKKGTPVYATADGVVETVTTQNAPGGAGLYITLKHDHGLLTQYLHLDQALVKKGDKVVACQKIALSGNSGKPKNGGSYDAHLDYRVRFQSDTSKFVDILCPCKAAIRSGAKGNQEGMQQDCIHSLFNRQYKFSHSGVKKTLWRIKYGHCMKTSSDLLPDEVK